MKPFQDPKEELQSLPPQALKTSTWVVTFKVILIDTDHVSLQCLVGQGIGRIQSQKIQTGQLQIKNVRDEGNMPREIGNGVVFKYTC